MRTRPTTRWDGGCWWTPTARWARSTWVPTRPTVAGSVVGVRLFSGYAGWDSGQLEAEIDEGSWYVVPAEPRDPISADPEGPVAAGARRQGGALAVVSGFPDDPAMN